MMTEKQMDKCPMCGKTDTLRIMEGDRVWIECMDGEDACGLSTGFFDTEAEAIAAWNRRADETDALKAALKDMWFAYTNKDENGLPHGFEIQAIEQAERILGEYDESHVEDITGLQQNQLDHGMFLSAQDEPNCCGKCNGSGKPSAEALLVAIGLLEGFYPIYEKVEGSDPLPEVIDWLRKVARE